MIRVTAAIGLALLVGLASPGRARARQAAAPSATPTTGSAPLTVQFSSNQPGQALYQWQFNFTNVNFVPDYTSDASGDLTFTYQNPGQYTARLRVYDATTGLPLPDQDVAITVLPPPVPPTVTLATVSFVAPGTVTFSAAATASPGRTISGYTWDFLGDGGTTASSTGGPAAQSSYTYQKTGVVYNVTVTAVDSGGLEGSATLAVGVGIAPTAGESLVLPQTIGPGNVALAIAAAPAPGWILQTLSWNFGDGSSGSSPGASAPAQLTHTYASAAAPYTFSLTATDSSGLSTTSSLGIMPYGTPPAAGAPTVVALSYGPVPLVVGTSATLTALAAPATPGDVLSVSWTFGDGHIGAGNPAQNQYNSLPPPPATTFTATATVAEGANATVATIQVAPVPQALGESLGLGFTPSFTADGQPLGPTVRVGHVVTFTLKIASPSGPLTQAKWDFDGDGLVDQIDQLFGVTFTDAPQYQYQTVGTYPLVVKAGTTDGIIDSFSQTITVVSGSTLECWVAQPQDQDHVYGNHVTLRAKTAPALLTQNVVFKYRPTPAVPPPAPTAATAQAYFNDPSWTTIGRVVPPPFSALSVPWDVTGLVAGQTYELAAGATDPVGNLALSSVLQVVTVTVDPANPTEDENTDPSQTNPVRIHVIDPDKGARSEIAQDTAVDLSPHSVGNLVTLRMERSSINPHPVEARFQGLRFLPNSFRRFSLGGAPLVIPARITLYDVSQDPTLSLLGVDPKKLRIYQFDDSAGQWVPLLAQVTQPSEDLIRASTVAMGDVGVVADVPAREGTGSSGSTCGGLGLEILLVPLAGLLCRRIRKSGPGLRRPRAGRI